MKQIKFALAFETRDWPIAGAPAAVTNGQTKAAVSRACGSRKIRVVAFGIPLVGLLWRQR